MTLLHDINLLGGTLFLPTPTGQASGVDPIITILQEKAENLTLFVIGEGPPLAIGFIVAGGLALGHVVHVQMVVVKESAFALAPDVTLPKNTTCLKTKRKCF